MTDIEGAALVRPDEHIAWRLKSGLDGDPILEVSTSTSCQDRDQMANNCCDNTKQTASNNLS
ncbi:hypothetical protein NC651_023937 [Populus alba x Populus x berolinensis]|nr:hypothetical protein NC651_023937 [Populus alba x Populus x berolinensis]